MCGNVLSRSNLPQPSAVHTGSPLILTLRGAHPRNLMRSEAALDAVQEEFSMSPIKQTVESMAARMNMNELDIRAPIRELSLHFSASASAKPNIHG